MSIFKKNDIVQFVLNRHETKKQCFCFYKVIGNCSDLHETAMIDSDESSRDCHRFNLVKKESSNYRDLMYLPENYKIDYKNRPFSELIEWED